jgi:catalase
VHAKGAGACGSFTVTHDITRYSRARPYAAAGKTTPTSVRFATDSGERGSADAEHDPRGFAIRCYAEDSIWGPAGTNTPTPFVQQGPD